MSRGVEYAVWTVTLALLLLAVWWGVHAWADCRTTQTFAYCLWSMG